MRLQLADDIQTDDSAISPIECAKRERVMAGAVLGLAGPGRKIAGFFPCTVIRKGDAADRSEQGHREAADVDGRARLFRRHARTGESRSRSPGSRSRIRKTPTTI